MTDFTFKEKMKSAAVKPLLQMVNDDPERNIPRILDWLEKLDRNKTINNQIKEVRRAMDDKGNWYELALSLWADINDEQRQLVMNNFVLNGNIVSNNRAEEIRGDYGCNVPWAILLDPTSACNLHCIGCWAADYGPGMNMSLETLDDIIRQGKKIGVFVYLYSGGEPLVRKKDIIT
ncbi:MAG TPA: radical SAM protein, partial [Clostridia bacterium]|nr:radical SAM protein [Clostridia bacterium]